MISKREKNIKKHLDKVAAERAQDDAEHVLGQPLPESVLAARAAFAEDRYIIVGDNSGHDYVIPMPQREHWDAWIGSDDWAAGVTPPYAMRVEGTLTFKEPSITYD